jgi:hypothetical protein
MELTPAGALNVTDPPAQNAVGPEAIRVTGALLSEMGAMVYVWVVVCVYKPDAVTEITIGLELLTTKVGTVDWAVPPLIL